MQIPIENIYYLLCYAWDKLEEKDQVKVAVDDRTRLLDLFTKILIRGTNILLKRGIEKNYVSNTMELAGVKGKLEMSATLKSGLHLKQKTICTIDEFSDNILSNQILITTLYRLVCTRELDPALKREIKPLFWKLSGIQTIELNKRIFSQVRLHRNNRLYAFLIKVCQIIYENTLPTEKPGEWHFVDFLKDKDKLIKLFESFLFNFYKREFPQWYVHRPFIYWQFISHYKDHSHFLPRMETDITIVTKKSRIIIDAKYYHGTLTDRTKIHSENLYQIFSYLLNQRSTDPVTNSTRGILIYPTITEEVDLDYWYEKHHIQIKTVNLNMHWRLIEERLKGIVT